VCCVCVCVCVCARACVRVCRFTHGGTEMGLDGGSWTSGSASVLFLAADPS
jgi:hypothetical protein